ncbi:MarR family winged helix-turn-helix transcriptional regulator [Corynebacterium sp. H128]|uniref:MarR family winged helix-turn-helix transcriptional regulator n=1 Tax=unclassified Corynebacterium TaxID=2624378 RepID=UPI00309A4537
MASPRWLTDEEQILWRLILNSIRHLERGMEDTLQQESGIGASEFAVLVSLSEAEDCGMRLRDLCQLLEWDRSRASHQITRMERRGLVLKHKCSDDARGVLVTITDDGLRRLEAAAPGHVESVRRLVFDQLTGEEVDFLRTLLERLVTPPPEPTGCKTED